ncbi:isoprenylcysteine carboxylmethyltransferase family protein [uncultured Thermanaerothrix sp.]|uniref:methyltransferase family protein n=1 Tax=uncultured Thermanaerothrix sp. TaxID=1195149 RepID=UPI00262600D5|nr:isoprenylcysteine carboxylmethyltransferase family protein [uncultured Thermanaerothrix sp.]
MGESGFGWVFLAMGLYGGLHSALASHAFKRFLARRWGAERVQRYYRLIYSLLGGLTLLPVLGLMALLPDQVLYRLTWPWLGFALFGQGLGVWVVWRGLRATGALAFLGVFQALGQNPAASPRLVTDDIYAWMRHPLYTGSMLALWCMPLMTCNLLAFNLAATLYFLLGARLEEAKLRAEFGTAYADYARRTPMFIPRPGALVRALCRCSG